MIKMTHYEHGFLLQLRESTANGKGNRYSLTLRRMTQLFECGCDGEHSRNSAELQNADAIAQAFLTMDEADLIKCGQIYVFRFSVLTTRFRLLPTFLTAFLTDAADLRVFFAV